MSIFQIVAVGIMGAVLSITIKKQNPEVALLIAIAASVIIFVMVLPLLSNAVGAITYIGELAGGHDAYIALTLRVVGVAYMAELGASVCKDAGESAIASKIDMAGRLIIVVMAMPIVTDILNIVTRLIP